MRVRKALAAAGLLAVMMGTAWAHITPPVVLVPERDALATQLAGAKQFSLREASLTTDERKAVQSTYGWRASDDVHNIYMGRDDGGKLQAASLFMSEATMHGIIRVAVGFTPDGRVRGAEVVEVSEEIHAHMKGLMDRGFTKRYAGLGVDSKFEAAAAGAGGADAMAQHYDSIVSRMVQRAAILYNTLVTKRGVN